MIAMWMAYALVTGTLLAAACWLLERIARAARLPTRGIWVAGMLAMLLISATALVDGDPGSRSDPAAATSGVAAVASVDPGDLDRQEDVVNPLRQGAVRLLSGVDVKVAAVALRLAAWDRPLLLIWALVAAFFAGIVAHAALEGRRIRQGLQPHDLEGTEVLLTEGVGPSAIAIGGPAILIPRWALELENELIRLVLRHEREHLTARDPLLLLATLLAVVLVPWHLPLWWSRGRLRLAIEVDCDRRVLRAFPDVRRYAQLLLLTAQRTPTPSWAHRPVASVVAPLGPHATHLARRISAMTQPHTSRTLVRTLPLAMGVIAIASVLGSLPTPPRALLAQVPDVTERAIVRLTSVGSDGPQPVSIMIYTTRGARVGIGLDEPVARADTLHLRGVPAITADVTEGEVHIEVSGPGRVSVGGTVTGGPAQTVSATGRHIVLLEGGIGIKGGS